jgi:hypothetical protein
MKKIIVLVRRIGYTVMYVFLIFAALALISSQNNRIVEKIKAQSPKNPTTLGSSNQG